MTDAQTASLRFRAMGCPAEILVIGARTPGGAADIAKSGARLLADLEAHWSRFLPSSDISRINRASAIAHTFHRAPSVDVVVDKLTRDVLERAVYGWQVTDGRYDPTVHAALVAQGYDRTFADLRRSAAGIAPVARPAIGCGSVVIDHRTCTVRVPAGVGLDLGGIGKGYAADLVVAALMDAGAEGVLVNVGGDVRVSGTAPAGDVWTVRVEHPSAPSNTLAVLRLTDGAIAASSTRSRRWRTASGDAHHVIDPASGLPTANDLVGATVVASTGWWAEVLTKALLVSGSSTADAVHGVLGDGAHGLVVTAAGAVARSPGLLAFLSPAPSRSVPGSPERSKVPA